MNNLYNLVLKSLATLIFVSLLSLNYTFSQTKEVITKTFTEEPVSNILEYLDTEYNYKIYYKKEWLNGLNKSVRLENDLISTALAKILFGTAISYKFLDDRVIVLLNDNNISSETYPVVITGKITDALTNDPVPNANVIISRLGKGVSTDINGNYKIEIPSGSHSILIKSLLYNEQQFNLNIYDNFSLDVELFQNTLELENINIIANNPEDNLNNLQPGSVLVKLERINKLPTFLGEVDVAQIISALPGVQSVGEGSSGFNVRGGGVDQNLILLDGIPIYNSSHLFGFFSIFNPEVVENFSISKGGFSSEYGDRLSSILNVEMKNPISEALEISGGVGPIISKLTASVPLKKKKAGILVSGRASYPTWILKKIDDPDISQSSASFQDLTAKLGFQIGKNDLINLSGYTSFDQFNLFGDSTYTYSSNGLSLNWLHNFQDDLSLQSLSYISKYESSVDDETPFFEFLYSNGLTRYGNKTTLSYFRNSTSYFVGAEMNYTKFSMGERIPSVNSVLTAKQLPDEKKTILSPFAGINHRISTDLNFEVGVRLSLNYLNTTNQFLFDEQSPKNEINIIDTVSIPRSKLLTSDLQPRLSVNYRLNSKSSLKFNYTRAVQYEFLLSSSSASLPTDIWKSSDMNTKPSKVHAFSSGYFFNLRDNAYEASIEGYYKYFDYLNIPKTGADVLLNEYVVTEIVGATGRSYGIEFLIKKNTEPVTGWLSYFYSKTENKTTGDFGVEQINNNKYFPSDFDRPHNINLMTSFKLSRLWTLSTTFNYSSGRPVTLPESSYVINGTRIFNVTERNNYRIAPSHRLDLSVTYEGSNKKDNRFDSSITFSIYNVYARQNPFTVYTTSLQNTIPRSIQLSVIGSAIPSITYNFKFK
ncbi:TonB-dependent receptor [Fulvivirga lutimaris]|uniref:TonB-dependent receptor n=1 Tax=Fulvivirga lutimaris TaxID=1819566 RepID=UPI0012BC3FE1|nr:TonB-dependent receptor [Fulvivirga lutimaris]MTI40373.1 TonB-dependent receptor [Fulvivirga lutimaris]